MSKPYLLLSDIHAHFWSAFSTTGADGVNSRLAITLKEISRAVEGLVARGGSLAVIAGDTFHVRGSISPSVFNPVHAIFQKIQERVGICAIPGNHDLEGRDTCEVGNAIQALSALPNFRVCTDRWSIIEYEGRRIILFPWHADRVSLLESMAAAVEDLKAKKIDPRGCDAIIHCGIDGVLSGVPDSGLSADMLAVIGFQRVFAGHYHHHCDFGNGVYSIGATTHQTWSDIGSKAGFVFVYPDRIEWQASHAPEFVEITGEDDPDEIPLIVDGNYVRVRSMKLSDAEIKTFRTQLEEMGARGVSFQVAREAVAARAGAVAGAASTLDESVDKFIDTLTEIDVPAVKTECTDVLSHIRSIAA